MFCFLLQHELSAPCRSQTFESSIVSRPSHELASQARVSVGNRPSGSRSLIATSMVVAAKFWSALQILQPNALPCAHALPGFLDAREEACVILEPVVEQSSSDANPISEPGEP